MNPEEVHGLAKVEEVGCGGGFEGAELDIVLSGAFTLGLFRFFLGRYETSSQAFSNNRV